MHRDDADALNRALDELATGLPMSGGDIDPNLLETARWFDDLGQQVSPNPGFVEHLERELLNQAPPPMPAPTAPGWRAPLRRALARSRKVEAMPMSPHGSGRSGRQRAAAWGSWAIILALVALAAIGSLRFLPDGSGDDTPALAPGFPIEPDTLAEMAAHPIVGAWTVDPSPGLPTRVLFHADGTYIEVDPLQGTGVGVWRPTGERSGEVTVEWSNRNEPGRLAIDAGDTGGIGNPTGRVVEQVEGRSTMRSTFTVGEDGASFTGTYHLQQFSPDGQPVPVEAEGELAATRLTFAAPVTSGVGDLASHPVVGSWTLEAEKGPASVATFYADGTYIEVSPLQGTGVGVWRPMDERSGEVLVEWPNRSEAGRREAATLIEGYVEGWTTLQGTFTTSEDGTAYSGTYESRRYYPNGVGLHTEGPGDISGTRIALDAPGDAAAGAATPASSDAGAG